MITRVVRLTFKPEFAASFISIMQLHQEQIKNFKGCSHLNSYQDIHVPHVFFTISHWEDENALNEYRHSDFFKTLWSTLKPMFAEKTVAHSLGNM